MRNKIYKVLTILLLAVFLLTGCSIKTQTTQYTSKDLDEITQVVKNGMEQSLTFSYENTTGEEGWSYFTTQLKESTKSTEEYKQQIINQRKSLHIVMYTNITKVHDIKIIDSTTATAVADYTEKTTSTSKDSFNHNWTGYFDMRLKKQNDKWLIDDFQTVANK